MTKLKTTAIAFAIVIGALGFSAPSAQACELICMAISKTSNSNLDAQCETALPGFKAMKSPLTRFAGATAGVNAYGGGACIQINATDQYYDSGTKTNIGANNYAEISSCSISSAGSIWCCNM